MTKVDDLQPSKHQKFMPQCLCGQTQLSLLLYVYGRWRVCNRRGKLFSKLSRSKKGIVLNLRMKILKEGSASRLTSRAKAQQEVNDLKAHTNYYLM